MVQRATLLMLLALFVIYTSVEYVSTRQVLSHCIELKDHRETQVLPATSTPSQSAISSSTGSRPESGSTMQGNAQHTMNEGHETKETRVASKVGKVMVVYGTLAESDITKRVVDGHRQHALLQGHPFQLFERQVLDGLWTKHAWLLSVLLNELHKPEKDRLQWLHFCDADVVLMNQNVPLNTFLPPKDFDHINFLISNDHNGLNTGAFFVRVHEWSVRLLIDVLALRSDRPEEKLKYSEQSATEILLDTEKYKNNTAFVPQRWFNAYRGPREGDKLIRGATVPSNTIKEGDLQSHFAGKKKNKAHISEWLDYAANTSSGWTRQLKYTTLPAEVALFWKLEKERLSWDKPVVSEAKDKAIGG
ncbi:hypothetical protein CB0940_11396 [Cercospora beticola]|uniref:Uncharacterized protein n=1 Tax=Cercospora beticola TaxID=122368 RepID=A0A2G5HD54_CERBT|nr:hypothetical protein CB0940_11396 [Cercospora beticola]PIA90496.1 hypothetical protein CB0940_11396 [Cercospora beticola]WPB08243.1 hypothetical protein RHO25_012908 [Cercospora beticola]